MQPFSRRPNRPQDYESAPPPRQSVRPMGNQAAHYGQAPVSAIGAPRPRPAPVFHRQAPPPPAYSHDPYSSPYSQAPQSVAPPAPHSLAPVEMNAYAGQPRNYQTDRGVAHTNTTNIRPRPTWRTGAMILLAGVFVGGTFGIGVQARRNALDEQASMANAAVNVAPPAQALPPVQPQQAAAAAGPTALQPTQPQTPPQAYAQAPANAGLPPGAIVIPPQQGVVVVPPPGQAAAQAPIAAAQPQPQQPAQPQARAQVTPPAKKTVAWRAPAPPSRPAPATNGATSGAQIAAKVTAPKKEAPEPADPPEPPSKTKGGKKGATDAQSVLQDALRETTNTL